MFAWMKHLDRAKCSTKEKKGTLGMKQEDDEGEKNGGGGVKC